MLSSHGREFGTQDTLKKESRGPGDLPDPRTEPTSPVSPALGGRFFTVESPGKPRKLITYCLRLKGSWEWGMTAVWRVIFGG